jgi:hypothetical protein
VKGELKNADRKYQKQQILPQLPILVGPDHAEIKRARNF